MGSVRETERQHLGRDLVEDAVEIRRGGDEVVAVRSRRAVALQRRVPVHEVDCMEGDVEAGLLDLSAYLRGTLIDQPPVCSPPILRVVTVRKKDQMLSYEPGGWPRSCYQAGAEIGRQKRKACRQADRAVSGSGSDHGVDARVQRREV